MASRAPVGVRESGMRHKTFRPYDEDSLLLMPPSVCDWVASDSLAAFINDAVETLDLIPFLAAHDEPIGMPPYHPTLMVKVRSTSPDESDHRSRPPDPITVPSRRAGPDTSANGHLPDRPAPVSPRESAISSDPRHGVMSGHGMALPSHVSRDDRPAMAK
jgi:hypothetical protein